MYDVIIVGGGPAGLNAALVLARCMRKVLICDTGKPRNRFARKMHNYLSRDGMNPSRLLRLGRREVARYGVEWMAAEVVCARSLREEEDREYLTEFEVTLANQKTLRSRKLLVATGLKDTLPDIPGVESFYGKGVHHCPYCDAYEYREKRIVVFGEGSRAVGGALALRTWTKHVVCCSHGTQVPSEDRTRLDRNGIVLREERIIALEGGRRLRAIRFENDERLACDAFFFNADRVQQAELPRILGCEFSGCEVKTHAKQRTHVPGLYIAGDADGDVQFVVVAAGEGATAGVAINRELQDEDRGEPRLQVKPPRRREQATSGS